MKRTITVIGLAILFLANVQNIKGQEFDQIVKSGIDDANVYLKNYMNPVAASIGNGLANGWYNTAKPHKTLGFDITFTTNLATIPEAAKTFEFVASEYQHLSLDNPSNTTLPTFVGGETTQQLVISNDQGIDGSGEFNQNLVAPSGILGNLDYPGPLAVPTPTLQLGVGIVKNTDLIIRLTPEVNVGDFSFRNFGLGVKHDFKQWIPGMKVLPFDLSAIVAYNRMTTAYQIDEAAGQSAEFVATATTVQALISKKLLFFTPYAGLGFNIINSNFAVKGDYEFQADTETVPVTDPVNLDFEGSGGPRFTIGGRLKVLWALTLSVDYTIQKYNTLSVGLGINVR